MKNRLDTVDQQYMNENPNGRIYTSKDEYAYEYIHWLKSKIKNLSESSEPPTRCCAKLPNDEEIEQVAHDEAGGHDWDDLSQQKEFVKTFIEGAKWLRSQIK